MKIGLLIPTRGDRPEFLKYALKQISRQTLRPDFIEIVDDKPLSDLPDVTWRYRIGCDRLKAKGVDVIIFIEDDDYYSPEYIESMINKWEAANKPDLFGINHTVYYNISHQHWDLHKHPHASMMSTLLKTSAIGTFDWCNDNYSFTDMHLWTKTKLTKQTVSFLPNHVCLGIKHGIGLCGGGGHHWPINRFNNTDTNFEQLSKWVDEESLNFYRAMPIKSKVHITEYSMKKNPFLSIVTRRMEGKREELFSKHKESVLALSDMDYQQIFLIDQHKIGMHNANAAFQLAALYITGEYIWLLDDDDFIKNKNFIELLKAEACKNSDVIFFKNKILTGDGDEIYPKPGSWDTGKINRGQIGGSCFAFKKWVFDKYIHHFSKPSFGDWNFITEVMKDSEVKASWLDVLMFETGKVSRGQ